MFNGFHYTPIYCSDSNKHERTNVLCVCLKAYHITLKTITLKTVNLLHVIIDISCASSLYPLIVNAGSLIFGNQKD